MPLQPRTISPLSANSSLATNSPLGASGDTSPAGTLPSALGAANTGRASTSQASMPSISLHLDTKNPNATPASPADGISKTHSFIEGYDNAVVQTNIHLPADAQPVRTGRASNVATMDGIGSSPSASKASFRLAAIPDTTKHSGQTERLYQRALVGSQGEIKALADWANVHEAENEMLRARLRKQQHDFASLFEMVSATSARALDVVSLQTYMLRTVAGHFATPRVMIVRRMRPEDSSFYCTASQGLKGAQFRLHLHSPLCRFAFERGLSFSLRDLPSPSVDAPEIDALRQLGIDTAVPLLQEVDRTGAVLEGFLFLGPKLTRRPYTKGDIEFLDILSKMFAICLRNENLYRRSIIDTLTGVSSRGHFDAQLGQELQRASAPGGKSLGLMMLDVDHFKKFNDTYGHQVGDLVLKSLAKVLIEQVRNVDLVARYGGEEFAIICVEVEKNVVKEVAERLLNAVRNMEIVTPDGKPLHITASFGLACFPDDAQDATALVQMADMALYKSKDAGRDRVTVADGTMRTLPPPANPTRLPRRTQEGWSLLAPTPTPIPSALEIIQRKQAQAAKVPAGHSDADRRAVKSV